MTKKKSGRKPGKKRTNDKTNPVTPPEPDAKEGGGESAEAREPSRRTVRTRHLSRKEDTTVDADGHSYKVISTRISDTEEEFPVPYQGPASDHPAPVG